MPGALRTPQNFQSPYDATSLITHLAQSYCTPAACFIATSAIDGTVVAMTSYSSDLTGVPGYPGVTFKRNTGVIASQLQSESGNAFSQMEASMFLKIAGITEADVTAGKWAHAEAVLFVCNYESLNMGQLVMQIGHLAEFKQRSPVVVAEIKGLNNALTAQVGTVTRPECSHEFCDSGCTLVEADYTVTGTLTGVVSQTEFSDSGFALPAGWLNNGKIIFDAGTDAQATGTYTRDPNASDGETITINGAVFTFTNSPSGAYQIEINVNGLRTLDNAVTKLNVSTDPLVSVATYSRVGNTLLIVFDAVGTAGNSFTTTDSGGGITADQSTLSGGSSANLNGNYILRIDNNEVSTTFKLRTPAPYLPVIGQTYRAVAGCQKRLTDCQNRVENDGVTTTNNVENRKSFDWVPTLESFVRLPSSAG